MDAARAIADAVLYEGYILWPYRRSSIKNQQRWTFGGVYPRRHSEGRRGDDPWTMCTECLVQGPAEARVEVRVRFLHVVRREVARRTDDGLELVDELVVGSARHLAWDEAAEREVRVPALALAALAEPHRVDIAVPAGREEEPLADPAGRPAGAVLRSWEPLSGTLEIGAAALGPELFKLTAEIANGTPWAGGAREDALRRTFCSTHTVLRVAGGAFVSLTDPPEELRPGAEGCRNSGTWPVLVGEPGDRDTLLSSPIILEDHPRIAPESPGDLFDGTEIDQMLVLNILGMTDAEKAEMRDSDPRAREILERTEALTEEELMRLSGRVRELRPLGGGW